MMNTDTQPNQTRQLTGVYILPAIPPYCVEKRTPVAVVQWMGNRVLLRDLDMARSGVEYFIETDLSSLELDT